MALRTPEEKRPFLRERQQVDEVAEGWTFIAAASGGAAVLFPGVAPIAVPVGVLCAAFAYAFKKRKAACDAVIDDPPRPDFHVRTRAQRAWFDPERLAHAMTPAQVRFAEFLLDGDALLRAAVRADERAQGALMAARPDLGAWQSGLSDQFFDAFVDMQPETARLAARVSHEISADARLRGVGSSAPRGTTSLKDALPAEALRQLEAARITPRALQEIRPRAARPPRHPVDVLADELGDYSRHLEEEAAELEEARRLRPAPEVRMSEESGHREPFGQNEHSD